MPGDSPREAFDAFVDPLQRAIQCFGYGKISASPGGRDVVGQVHSWSLNREAGVSKQGWHFEASMHYEIIRDDREGYGPFRVTTRAYRYKIAQLGLDLARIHWHPVGVSSYTAPHVHVAIDLPQKPMSEPPKDTLGKHMPTGRMTFEDAAIWAGELGMPMAREDWRDHLTACQADHRRYRSWQ